jgi:hypothetical protein
MCDSEFEESRTSPKLSHHHHHLHDSLGLVHAGAPGIGGLLGADIPAHELASASLSSISLMAATQEAVADVVASLQELHLLSGEHTPAGETSGNFFATAGSNSGPGSTSSLPRNYFTDVDEGGFWLEAEDMYFAEATCPLALALDWCQSVEKKIDLIRSSSSERCRNNKEAAAPDGAAHSIPTVRSVGRRWTPAVSGASVTNSFASPLRIGARPPEFQLNLVSATATNQDSFASSVPFKSPSPVTRKGGSKNTITHGATTYYSSTDEGRGGNRSDGGHNSGRPDSNLTRGEGSVGLDFGSPQGHLRFGCCVERRDVCTAHDGEASRRKQRNCSKESIVSNLAFIVSSAFSCPIVPLREVFQDTLAAAAMNNDVPAHIMERIDKSNRAIIAGGVGEVQNGEPGVRKPAALPSWRPSAVLLAVSRHVHNAAVGLLYFAPSSPLWTSLAGTAADGCKRRAMDRLAASCSVFGRNGELPNFMGAMSVFPSFLAAHEETLQFLFFADGPLPVPERLMIAVMSAARHRSEYLVRYFGALLTTSAPEDSDAFRWMESGPPPKLAGLQHLIALAAHKPWSITSSTVESLCEAQGWTTQELAHAMSIISTVLSLCSFCGGLFISNDIQADCLLPVALATCSPARASPAPESSSTASAASAAASQQRVVNYSIYTGVDTIQSEPRIGKAAKGAEGAAISETSFSWGNDGAPTLEELYEGYSGRFSAELSEARNAALSVRNAEGRFCRLGDDPVVAWRALRLYLLNILGVVVDEFNYSQINNRLSFGAKRFAQKTVVNPERVLASEIFGWKWDAPAAMATSPSIDSFCSGPTYHLNTTVSTPVSPFVSASSSAVPSCSFDDQLAILKTANIDRAGNTLPELQEELLVLSVSISAMMARRETLLTICMSKMTEYFRR